MPLKSDENEPLVEMLFRNGTLTVSGILLSFSLTFVTQWAHNPIPWELEDLPTLLLLGVGIVLQFMSMMTLLRHDSLRRRVYDRASRLFLLGIGTTTAGVLSAIVIDFIQLLVTGSTAGAVAAPV
ncbi:hypothetical protein ACFOEZ_08435 [Tianweitania populi]|uniref:Uncharacterized protein n=1 Tax=Tianweitania populi TaxID=1607949 RepID=A0A8J3GK96_9HYPH|nr:MULTISPECIES: hypothetical protein [Tianweitania]GHD11688.1 hypothetical protein GCM10016234_15130 [Tianweitania populi]